MSSLNLLSLLLASRQNNNANPPAANINQAAAPFLSGLFPASSPVWGVGTPLEVEEQPGIAPTSFNLFNYIQQLLLQLFQPFQIAPSTSIVPQTTTWQPIIRRMGYHFTRGTNHIMGHNNLSLGTMSPADRQSRSQVIRSADEFQAALGQFGTLSSGATFDPNRETGVFISLGARESSGYGINIDSVTEEKGRVKVLWNEFQPPAGAPIARMLTSPGVLIKFGSVNLPVDVIKTN